MVPEAGAWAEFVAKTSLGNHIAIDFAYETPTPTHTGSKSSHLDPVTGKVREWVSPSGDSSGPYAMAIDTDDRIWFVETGSRPNKLIGFSPNSGTFISKTEIPSDGGSVRHMVHDPKTDNLWFGTDRGTLGQARIPAAS